jgi:hypothetical protein
MLDSVYGEALFLGGPSHNTSLARLGRESATVSTDTDTELVINND